jgi:hypothetical protein
MRTDENVAVSEPFKHGDEQQQQQQQQQLDENAAASEPFKHGDERRQKQQQQLQHGSCGTTLAAAAGDAANEDRFIGMPQVQAVIQERQASVGVDVDCHETVGAS